MDVSGQEQPPASELGGGARPPPHRPADRLLQRSVDDL